MDKAGKREGAQGVQFSLIFRKHVWKFLQKWSETVIYFIFHFIMV